MPSIPLFGRPMTATERSRRHRKGTVPGDRERWEEAKCNELLLIMLENHIEPVMTRKALQWARDVLKHTKQF